MTMGKSPVVNGPSTRFLTIFKDSCLEFLIKNKNNDRKCFTRILYSLFMYVERVGLFLDCVVYRVPIELSNNVNVFLPVCYLHCGALHLMCFGGGGGV